MTEEKKGEMPGVSEKEIEELIRNHVYAAMGMGLIPVPLLDFVGVGGVQISLLKKMAGLYGLPFEKDIVKKLISALMGAAFPVSLGVRLGLSLAKSVPVVGHSLGAVSVSALSGASVYAVGKVFNRHFSEGGTFLSFNPQKAQDFYQEMFKEGRKVAGKIKKDDK